MTVTATNSGSQTGPASAPPVSVQTCITAAPVLASPTVAPGQVTLTWTYNGPASPVNTGYIVTLHPVTPTGADTTYPVAGASTLTKLITGLVNGNLYSATVVADYGSGHTSAVSNAQQFSPPPNRSSPRPSPSAGPPVRWC